MPARVGVDLRPVQSDRAHLQHAHLARELKNLDEQLLDVFQEAPPKRRDRVVVGMIVARNEPKRHRIPSRPLQLAAGEHPRRIAVNQQGPATSADDTKPNRSRDKLPLIRPRSRPSITSTINRARCFSGSHSSTEGGNKNPVSDRSSENCSSKPPAALRESAPDSSVTAGAALSPTGC